MGCTSSISKPNPDLRLKNGKGEGDDVSTTTSNSSIALSSSSDNGGASIVTFDSKSQPTSSPNPFPYLLPEKWAIDPNSLSFLDPTNWKVEMPAMPDFSVPMFTDETDYVFKGWPYSINWLLFYSP